jgi:hypothetical protein
MSLQMEQFSGGQSLRLSLVDTLSIFVGWSRIRKAAKYLI